MDLAKVRKTADGKVSVIDTIAQIKKCSCKYASEVHKRLLEEERVLDCEARILTSATRGRQNRSEYDTPLASAAESTMLSRLKCDASSEGNIHWMNE